MEASSNSDFVLKVTFNKFMSVDGWTYRLKYLTEDI